MFNETEKVWVDAIGYLWLSNEDKQDLFTVHPDEVPPDWECLGEL